MFQVSVFGYQVSEDNSVAGLKAASLIERKTGVGTNIGQSLFVGWVRHPDIFCWVSFLNPTYLPAVFVLLAKPNKMA